MGTGLQIYGQKSYGALGGSHVWYKVRPLEGALPEGTDFGWIDGGNIKKGGILSIDSKGGSYMK